MRSLLPKKPTFFTDFFVIGLPLSKAFCHASRFWSSVNPDEAIGRIAPSVKGVLDRGSLWILPSPIKESMFLTHKGVGTTAAPRADLMAEPWTWLSASGNRDCSFRTIVAIAACV